MGSRIFDVFDTRAGQVAEYIESGGGNQVEMQRPGVGNDGTIMPVPLDAFNDDPLQVEQQMDFAFGMEPPKFPHAPSVRMPSGPPAFVATGGQSNPNDDVFNAPLPIEGGSSRAQRNPSVISYGNGLRNMSLTSDATFGRAMSGLSALSIDWENLEDFDLEVDHSAHINNGGTMSPNKSNANGPRRSSIRRSFMSTSGEDKDMHVSFKV